jgi:Recombinase
MSGRSRRKEAEPLQVADFDALVLPIIIELRDKGMSTTAIARILTARHVATRRGGVWTPQQVRGLLARAGLAALRSDRR